MLESEHLNELAAALAAAQLEMTTATKASINPHYKSKYADLASVSEVTKLLNKHGIAVICSPRLFEGSYAMVCKLVHTSGQWVGGFFPLSPNTAKPQEIGSSMTYARRYLTCALAGIATEDDDGNAAAAGVATSHSGPITTSQIEVILHELKNADAKPEDLMKWVRKTHPNITGIVEIPSSAFDAVITGIRRSAAARKSKDEKDAQIVKSIVAAETEAS